jgi:putative colanic acid biosynthesis acetyltransferase WcaF
MSFEERRAVDGNTADPVKRHDAADYQNIWFSSTQRRAKRMLTDEQDIQQFREMRARPMLSKGLLIKRALWSIVEATLYRFSLHGANRWRAMLLRMFGAKIAPGCTIRRTSTILYPWNFAMGAVSCLGEQCVVYNLGPVTLGERVLVSQEAYLCAGSHDYRYKAMPLTSAPIALKDDCWVCARAFVAPGVSIGAGAIVAAGAVVVRDVADWTIVGGNPAQFIKDRPPPQ